MHYTAGTAETLALAVLALYIGIFLTNHLKILDQYKIPTPVIGGIVFSLLGSLLYKTIGFEMDFSNELRDFLMLAFFATIGLSAKLRVLKQGGKTLLILLLLATLYLFLQNAVGIAIAWLTGMHPAIGLIGGSITLTGGHGTGIAWTPQLIAYFDLGRAYEITIACATAGLVLGGLIGGPIGSYLINKYKLQASTGDNHPTYNIDEYIHTEKIVDLDGMLESIALISFCIVGGSLIYEFLENAYPGGFGLPQFVATILVAVVVTNMFDFTRIHRTNEKSLNVCGELSLGIFLAISMMNLKLWNLVDLALPLVLLLAIQTAMIVAYSIFVIHRFCGNNYTSSVIAAGYSGLAMGATPVAIANMSALTQRFGYSAQAFLVISLMGAFFIDILNSLVINMFINLNIYP